MAKKESVAPPGPQKYIKKYVVFKFLFEYVEFFLHLWSYERSKVLGNVVFLAC